MKQSTGPGNRFSAQTEKNTTSRSTCEGGRTCVQPFVCVSPLCLQGSPGQSASNTHAAELGNPAIANFVQPANSITRRWRVRTEGHRSEKPHTQADTHTQRLYTGTLFCLARASTACFPHSHSMSEPGTRVLAYAHDDRAHICLQRTHRLSLCVLVEQLSASAHATHATHTTTRRCSAAI